MAWIKLEKMYEQEKTSSKGKKYKCFTVEGMKKGYKSDPDSPWSKDLFPGRDNEIINQFKAVGIGNMADVTSQKDDKGFWKVVSVSRLGGDGGGGGSTPSGDKGSPDAPPKKDFPVVYQAPAAPGDSKYIGCLKVASDMVLGMMAQSVNFEKLIKRTATPELVKQMVVDLANHFFTNDPEKAAPSGADSSGVSDGDGTPDPKTPPAGEEDVPF